MHPFRFICVFCLALSSCLESLAGESSLPPAGMIVYKLHKQQDDYAPVVEYRHAEFFPTVVNMNTTQRGYFSVKRGQVVYHIDYPSPAAELLRDRDHAALKRRIQEYRMVSKRFKRAAPLLLPWIRKFKSELQMWDQGFGKAGGQWVNRASFTFDQERAKIRQEFARKKAKILGNSGNKKAEDGDPPLWAEDLQAQLEHEQAMFREGVKKRIERKTVARAEAFQRGREEQSSPLSSSPGLDRASGLERSQGLGGRGRR